VTLRDRNNCAVQKSVRQTTMYYSGIKHHDVAARFSAGQSQR